MKTVSMGFMTPRAALCLFALATLSSGEPLHNTGAPMAIPFDCTEEDTRQAGLDCSEDEPCRVYLELSGAEAVLNKIFLAGNLHSAEATLSSVLLSSSDGGQTWEEPFYRLRFAALDQIQFTDFENGRISGAYLGGIPHNPFFLVTTDRGGSWREQPVFEEERAGLIERFGFESSKSGWMLIGASPVYELYFTDTAGESWVLRQSSGKPLELPLKRSAEPLVRIQTDAKTRAYRIEIKQGNAWSQAASFSVNVGQCTK